MPVKEVPREFQQMASTGGRGQRAYRRGRRTLGTRWEKGVLCPEQANGAPSKGDLLALSPQQETGRHAVIPLGTAH